jgi:hypothetical protein
LKEQELLEHLKKNLKDAETLRRELDGKIDKWSREFEGEPYEGDVNKNKSTIVSRDIKKQSLWQHANLINPFVSSNNIIKCYPVTWEDNLESKRNEISL